MLLFTVVLASALAGAQARPAAADEKVADLTRRRGVDQCRIVDPSPRLSGGRGARQERAVTERSRARAWAALRRDEQWSSLSPAARRHRREDFRRGSFFSAARTLDLELGVVVRRNVAADARVELRLLTPRGHLYQALRAAAAPEETLSAKAAKKGSGAGGAGKSARATPSPLRAAVPVAGTAIVNHSLYGRWTVEPWLDGEPCGDPVRFWIGE